MAAAILNHNLTAAQALTGTGATPAAAAASSTDGTSSTTSSSATISANDFLTLLVTEMKNQDPTADVDPNEYINQLVNVNSLEQLISINQTLSSALGSTPVAQTSGAPAASVSGASAQAQPASPSAATTVPGAISAAAAQLAPGNLGIPAVNSAAQSVAQALSGQPRVQ
jgi:flagellar basal-body rod modification protein FlgD